MREDTRNGVRAPTPGTLGAAAWSLFDELGYELTVKAALIIARQRGLNENNIRTELCHWRRYNGIKM